MLLVTPDRKLDMMLRKYKQHLSTSLHRFAKEKINSSQRQRAWLFQKTSGKTAENLEVADCKTFTFGKNTKISFSEPVFHGPENSMLGWTIMTLFEYDGERFMFAPDVQGPMSPRTLELIKNARPQVVMVGGPPFYLSGFKVKETQLQNGLRNMEDIVGNVPLTILDHHALRDEQWKQKISSVYEEASNSGHEVLTAAEFAGHKNKFLEFARKKLYADYPLSREFKKWMRTNFSGKKVPKPPV